MRRTPIGRFAHIRRGMIVVLVAMGVAIIAAAAWRTRTASRATPAAGAAAPSASAVTLDGGGGPASSSPRVAGETVQRSGPVSPSHIRRVTVPRTSSRAPATPQPGLYGEIARAPRTDITPFLASPPTLDTWSAKPFGTMVSELSPAVLYRTTLSEVTFFNGIEQWGHGGPTHVAIRTAAGVVVAGRGERIDGALQTEPWLLAWFAGADGWLFDVPWLVVLEHRSQSIGIDADGLRVRFGGPGGRLVAMPFYGYYKAPPAGRKWSDLLDGAVDFGIDTSTWASALPDSVAARAQWWAQVLRRYPVRCIETFRVDRLNDLLTIRSAFEYIEIRDDWGTPPRTLAPLSPTLALALTDEHNTFPMRFSASVTDPFVMTAHGPYMGIEDQTSYEVEFETLKYINEVERAEPPPPDAPRLAREADARLQATALLKWRTADRMAVDYGPENYVWAAMGDRFYPMALPYIRSAAVRANARESLRKYFGEWVLQKERFAEYQGQVPAWRGALLLQGPGIGSWGELGDAGKFSENLYPNLWSYAHYADDIGTIEQRWDLVKKLDITPLESGWKGFGRNSIAEMGDEAAPPIDYARLAWMAGDIDTYYYQCYIATRELLHQFVKQNGAQYFRKLQPYHQYFLNAGPKPSIEPIPANVFVSNLYGGLHGWQVDGPTYPSHHGERQYQNRWVRFSSPSVGRFYRDHIQAQELRAEFDDWKRRFEGRPEPGTSSQWVRDDPHIMPSLVRLLSLTLDAPIAELDALAAHQGQRAPYDRWRLQPDSGVFASAISIVRQSHPRRYDRLIPKSGAPGPFVLGLERSIPSQWSVLIQQLETWDANKKLAWPVVGWTNWQTPRQPATLPGSQLFGFGAVTPRPGRPPRASGGWTQVNWNTYVEWYQD